MQELVAAAQAGGAAAFTELVLRFRNMAYGYATSLLRDRHLAEDAAQEAFIDAYRKLGQLREPAAFPGWFRRVVFKQCDRIARSTWSRTRLDSEGAPIDRGAAADGRRAAVDRPGGTDADGGGGVVGRRRAAGAASVHAGRDARRGNEGAGGRLAIAAAHSRTANPEVAAVRSQVRNDVLAAIAALPEHERTVTSLFYTDDYSLKEIALFLGISVPAVKSRLHRARMRLRTTLSQLMEETMGRFGLPESFATAVASIVRNSVDLQGARKHLGGSYHDRKDPDRLRSLDAASDAGIYVVREHGVVESAGYYGEMAMGIDGVALTAARPREVANEAEGVPDPVFIRGFAGCFKMALERGVHLAAVHGSMFDHAFAGFVPTFYHPVATANREDVRFLDTGGAVVRPLETDADKEAAQQAFTADPYAAKMGGWAPRRMNYMVVENGEVTGYFAWYPDWYGEGYLASVTLGTRTGANAVLRFMADETGDAEVRVQESHMTAITQAVLAAGGAYRLRPACPFPGLDNEMVAIIDFRGLADELRQLFARRAYRSLGIGEATLSIEMDGETVGFRNKDGSLVVDDATARVHRRLPRWVVTRLIMGYYSGAEVRTMGALAEDDGRPGESLSLPANEASLFDALFPKLWPSSLPDPDVWPWVIGEPHPRYQHEEAKSIGMRAKIDGLRFPWLRA